MAELFTMLLLSVKDLTFPKDLELHFFTISIPEFLCVSVPYFETSKNNEMDKFLFLGTHKKERIMVTLLELHHVLFI